MRTERIALEVTHDLDARLSDWIVEVVDESLGLMESVRVVEDDRVLAASRKLIEVDQEAALRGFDTTTFQRLWISAIARVLGLELARPPRSKCDNPGDGSIPSPGILASPALVEAHQQSATLTAERDAAIRERESLREQLESVACRAATAETALAEIKSLDYTRAAVNGAAWQANKIAAKALEAASGGGEGEPVAWGVVEHRGGPIIVATPYEDEANQYAGTVVPLYRQPPQPRGWLTEEEIAVCVSLRHYCQNIFQASGLSNYLWRGRAIVLEGLLARSSPPEVVLPKGRTGLNDIEDKTWINRNELLAALTAAGVAVKEVGRG
jgi:hypothetical protein